MIEKSSEVNFLHPHYNLILAISNKKIIAYEIYKDSINSEKYLAFITKNNESFKNNVILQDNVRFNHSKSVKEYAKKNNIEMNYTLLFRQAKPV